MNFFPTPYADELLYSTLSRYCVRSGNIKDIHSIEDLFGTRNCIAVMELATNLDSLVKNMPVNTGYTAEYFIYKHTLFPYYSAFITKERAEQIITSMKEGRADISYIKLGLISSGVTLNKFLRFCPECFKEDIERYGEPYWHRVHQIPGVYVCSKHKVPTYDSTVLIRSGNRQKFFHCNSNNCIVDKVINLSDKLMERMIWMAEDAEVLLNNRLENKPEGWFASQIRIKLIEENYAKMNNYIYQKRLKEDLEKLYGIDYLDILNSSISGKSGNWLTNIIRNSKSTTHTLRYLLLTRFLNMNLYELFSNANMAEGDINFNSINAYEKLWEEKLIRLSQEKLSIREIATILNSTPKTIRKTMDRLGIEPYWKFNGGGKYINIKYTETEEFKLKRKETREKWLKIHHDNLNMSSNQIRAKNDGLYSWLRKYDNEWFKKHT